MNILTTPWGEETGRKGGEHILEEYPRPQMVRDSYINLNGYWDYHIDRAGKPARFMSKSDGRILVPFSPESALSGVELQLRPKDVLWYKRILDIPEGIPSNRHFILHFGAVDQRCELFVNGYNLMSHTGGYLPFSCDITEVLFRGENEIVLRVEDDSDTAYHARGKQKLKRGGMFYTASSGIWQSVWGEWVCERYIKSLCVIPDPDRDMLDISMKLGEIWDRSHRDDPSPTVTVRIHEPAIRRDEPDWKIGDKRTVYERIIPWEPEIRLSLETIAKKKHWSPEEPWLYDMEISVGDDEIGTYFALRTFTVEKPEGEAHPRICLDHSFYYQTGVLDQGYWPESLMTPPSDEAMIFDLKEMKATGFNMARKHLKIEPDRWYYHCDRLGIIVWQDMVNGGDSIHQWFVTYMATPLSLMRVKVSDRMRYLLSRTSGEGREEFEKEVGETVRLLRGHPCICTWVIFNEGWGQFDTDRMTEVVRGIDRTRLIDQASGWFDQRGGDLVSVHNYFFKLKVIPEKKRAAVLSEIGGRVLYTEGHCQADKTYGYSVSETPEHLNMQYKKIMQRLKELIPMGLCASVYTQWTDIEDEINGIYTYDRKVRKIRHPGEDLQDTARRKPR